MTSSAAQPTEQGFLANFKYDLPASFVVFLVALPLCMGIAIASGAPPASGLLTGIIGGLVVGFLAGSPLQVSGPAAGLSVVVYELIQKYKVDDDIAPALVMLGFVVFVAGLIQIASGLLRVGQWFRAVSPAVIQGMLAGIGVLIFSSQFHVMVDDKPRANGVANIASLPEAVMKGAFDMNPDHQQHRYAAMIGLATIISLIGWQWLPWKKLKLLPGPLVAVLVGTILAGFFGLEVHRISVPDKLADGIRMLPLGDIFSMNFKAILVGGATMAMIASAETLLCASAVDQLHQGPRTNYDRELLAQGIGNTLCGVLGGLPMTGVIVRSSANVEAGGRTRASAIMHGAWLLLFVAVLPHAIERVPQAVLAAILVYTGYKLMNFKGLIKLFKVSKSEAMIFVITVGAIVATDLLTGVLIGIAVSGLKLIRAFTHLKIDVKDDPVTNRTEIDLVGVATFIRLPQLAAVLEGLRPNTRLHVHLEHLQYIDHACLDLLMTWRKQHESSGGQLIMDWENLQGRFSRQPLVQNGSDGGLPRSPRTEAEAARI